MRNIFWLLQLVEAVAATSAADAEAQITAAATDANKNHRSQVAAVRKWTPQKLKFSPKNHELFIPSCCLFIHPLKAEKVENFQNQIFENLQSFPKLKFRKF